MFGMTGVRRHDLGAARGTPEAAFSNFGLGGDSDVRRAGWLNFGTVLQVFTLLGRREFALFGELKRGG